MVGKSLEVFMRMSSLCFRLSVCETYLIKLTTLSPLSVAQFLHRKLHLRTVDDSMKNCNTDENCLRRRIPADSTRFARGRAINHDIYHVEVVFTFRDWSCDALATAKHLETSQVIFNDFWSIPKGISQLRLLRWRSTRILVNFTC